MVLPLSYILNSTYNKTELFGSTTELYTKLYTHKTEVSFSTTELYTKLYTQQDRAQWLYH